MLKIDIFIGRSQEIIRLCAFLFIPTDIVADRAQKACKSTLPELLCRFFGESAN